MEKIKSGIEFLPKKITPGVIFEEDLEIKEIPTSPDKYISQCIRPVIIGEEIFVPEGPYYKRLKGKYAISSYVKTRCREDNLPGTFSIPQIITGMEEAGTNPDCYQKNMPRNTLREEVAFSNGILNVRTEEFREKAYPGEMILTYNNVPYPVNTEPTYGAVIEKYLESASGGDPEWIHLAWSIIAAVLGSSVAHKRFFYLYGVPDSGKSVFVSLLERLVGEEFRAAFKMENLTKNFGMDMLPYTRLLIGSDNSATKLKDTSAFKQLVSGGLDPIPVSLKYKDSTTMVADNVRVIVVSNHAPSFEHMEDVEPFFNRMVLLPFFYSVPEEKRQEELIDWLYEERGYIVKKAMFFYNELCQNGFRFPQCTVSERLKAKWFEELNNVEAFLNECCVRGDDCIEETKLVFKKYEDFCNENGFPPVTVIEFNRALERKGILRRRAKNTGKGNRPYVYVGICLL